MHTKYKIFKHLIKAEYFFCSSLSSAEQKKKESIFVKMHKKRQIKKVAM